MSRCRSCGAEIIWARTAGKGKLIPLDAEPAERPNGLFKLMHVGGPDEPPTAFIASGEEVYLSHFATCPNAAEHRR